MNIQANFGINRSVIDIRLPRKEIMYTDGQTDERTDGRAARQTDGQTSRTTTIGSFFEKKKKLLKINIFRNF